MIALLAAAVISATSNGMPPLTRVPEPVAPFTARSSLGGALYQEHCSTCHGAQLQGSAAAPGLLRVGAADVDFMLTTGRMPLEVPGTEPTRGEPSFTPREIDALVSYVVSHGAAGGPPVPELHPGGDLPHGRMVYEENCQACHGVDGEGAIVGYGWLAPPLTSATPRQIGEAVRVGPGVMPHFDAHLISGRDLDALTAYVVSLRKPQNPGGWSIGDTGPTGEGLVAWLLGLGGIVVAMRGIGEKLR